MTDYEFMALGTRCTAATIGNINNIRKAAYPFDWINTPVRNILKFVETSQEESALAAFIDNYFNEVRSQRHPDDSWFPHDFLLPDDSKEQLQAIKTKFLRRFKRMFDLFNSGKNILFFSVFDKPHVYEEDFDNLKSFLKSIVKGQLFFITINLKDSFYENYGVSPHINLPVNFSGDWEQFDKDISDALKENQYTKEFFT